MCKSGLVSRWRRGLGVRRRRGTDESPSLVLRGLQIVRCVACAKTTRSLSGLATVHPQALAPQRKCGIDGGETRAIGVLRVQGHCSEHLLVPHLLHGAKRFEDVGGDDLVAGTPRELLDVTVSVPRRLHRLDLLKRILEVCVEVCRLAHKVANCRGLRILVACHEKKNSLPPSPACESQLHDASHQLELLGA